MKERETELRGPQVLAELPCGNPSAAAETADWRSAIFGGAALFAVASQPLASSQGSERAV